MLIIPALDLRGGHCVRLHQGDFDQETIFSANPLEVAREFVEQGAQRLHIVDLDAARETGHNRQIIREITRQLAVEVEVGGGLRSLADLAELFEAGAAYAIMGTAAYQNPELVAEAVQCYPGQIIVGLDARDGLVSIRGWLETVQVSAVDLGCQMRELGVDTVIFTDISRDGTLTGPNLAASIALAQKTGLQVIVSGGVAGLEDLEAIAEATVQNQGVIGAIVGKALYTGAINLAEAIATWGGAV